MKSVQIEVDLSGVIFADDALIGGALPNAELVRASFMDSVEKLSADNHDEYGKLAETSRIEARYDYTKVENFINRPDNMLI